MHMISIHPDIERFNADLHTQECFRQAAAIRLGMMNRISRINPIISGLIFVRRFLITTGENLRRWPTSVSPIYPDRCGLVK